MATFYSIGKRLNIDGCRGGLHAHLLINDDNNEFNLANNWKINKKFLLRVIAAHTLLLLTWIFWKCLTSSTVSITVTDTTTDITVNRNDSIWSYWILFIVTTIVKYICRFLVNVTSDNNEILLFQAKHLQIMINIFTSILFSFGLKFVFSNIKHWDTFIMIAVINTIFNVFVNGSLQSHQYGKRIINGIKQCLNKRCLSCCKC